MRLSNPSLVVLLRREAACRGKFWPYTTLAAYMRAENLDPFSVMLPIHIAEHDEWASTRPYEPTVLMQAAPYE